MRTTLATLSMLGLLLGCERKGDREAAADLDRPAADTAATTLADTTAGDTLDWRPAPPGLPPGARAAVLAGDPSKPGPYTIRIDAPAGYRVPPHHHPRVERVRVLQGTFMLGHGKEWSQDKLEAIAAGGEATVPALAPHFVEAKDRALVEVRGTGPYEIVYENPADDPRKAPIQ
jgi:hypothetical protein